MSKTSFTHGPWENEGEDYFADMPFIRISKGRPICEVIPPIDLVDMDEESRANAHLIAAAPELYEALSEILPWHDSHPIEATDNPLINKCRAALAKARGEIP